MTPDQSLEPLLDTHVHLWNLAHPRLKWNWVDTPDDHPILGEIDSVKMRAFEMHHLMAESRFAGVDGFVHVQAAIGSADPTEETRWLTKMAGRCPALKALIAHVDIGSDAFPAQMAEHEQSPLFRGVRDFAMEPYLAAGEDVAAVERDLRTLASGSMVLDLDCEYPNMGAAHDLAERHPELVIVLEHMGFPRRRDDDYFDSWSAAVADLACAPNVICKISGIVMTDRTFSMSSLRRWIRHCVESFGPDRVMVGSNWPLDRIAGSYDAILAHIRGLIAEDTPNEQIQMLRGTAQRVYRIQEAGGS